MDFDEMLNEMEGEAYQAHLDTIDHDEHEAVARAADEERKWAWLDGGWED